MNSRSVWFWKDLYPLLQRFCQEHGVGLNEVVNRAVQEFLRAPRNGGVLGLLTEKMALKREEAGLKDDWRVIARSGSYLPQYVDKVVRPVDSPFRVGQVPLRALSKDEEDVFLRIAHRREEIALRLVEINRVLLPEKRFRLKPESKPRSRRRDRTKPFGKGGA